MSYYMYTINRNSRWLTLAKNSKTTDHAQSSKLEKIENFQKKRPRSEKSDEIDSEEKIVPRKKKIKHVI